MVVKPSYGLADDEIARMLREGFASAEADMRRARCAKRGSRPSGCCWPRASALAADGDLLDAAERAAIERRHGRAGEAAARRRPPLPSTRRVEALAEGTEAFAADAHEPRHPPGAGRPQHRRGLRGDAMPVIRILPHPEYCPQGDEIEAPAGTSICEALLENGIAIEHACEMSCACTTCHVIVREGFDSLGEMDESEEDLLDRAWGLEPTSRLSCQAILSNRT